MFLQDQHDPIPGVTTAGQLYIEDFEELVDEGYKTVVNIRCADEPGLLPDEEEHVQNAGLKYIHFPVGEEDMTIENAEKLAALMTDDACPMVIHCRSANRVGALFALKAFFLDGLDETQSIELGRKAGLTRLEDPIRAMLTR